MSPFTPSGDRARWRVLYELLRSKEVGDVVTYREMGKVLDLHPDRDRQTMQLAMRRAVREYLTVDKRATDVIPNEGYRVVEAVEQLGLARRHQRSASRSLDSARAQLDNVDWARIQDPEARRALELAGVMLGRQQDMMRRMDIRQRRLEEIVDAVAVKSERTDAELDELRARLARLEAPRATE